MHILQGKLKVSRVRHFSMMDLRNRLKELPRGIQTVLLYFVDDFKTYVFKLREKFKLKDREVIKEISHIFFFVRNWKFL